MTEYPILNIALLHEITAEDQELIEELLILYIENVQERLERLQEMVAQNNSEVIAREIHTMKGSSASIGAAQMEVLLKSLEQFFREGRQEEFNELLSELNPTFQRFAEHVYELRKVGFTP